MTTTPSTVGSPLTRVEPKPDQPTPADRAAEALARHIEGAQEWGSCPQASLTRLLADLIALAEEDADLSFAEALADAWQLD